MQAKLKSLLNTFGQNEAGVTAPIFALMMVPLFAAVAAAMTFGDMFWRKTAASIALDTAVLAATILPDGASDEARIQTARTAYGMSLKKSVRKTSNETEVRFVVAAADKDEEPVFLVSGTSVSGKASLRASPGFVALLGRDSVSVTASATAKKVKSEPVCILALDETEQETIDLNGRASIVADKCAAMGNSSNATGLRQVGSAQLKASQIAVTSKGYQGDNFDPKPETGVRRIEDPYANVRFPEIGQCINAAQRLQQSIVTLDPGTYCGGLYIKAGSHVTLNAGIYVFTNGPLRIDSGSTVFGREVLISFSGPDATLQLYSGATLDLTSPRTGTYQNIQFYGARETHRRELWATAIGDSVLKFDGAMYLPTQHIWFAGGSAVAISSPTYAIVTKKLWVQDNTVLTVKREDKRDLRITEAARFEYSARLVK